MRIALSEAGVEIEAQRGASGVCRGCGERVFPKCGAVAIWHWCHLPNSKCVHAHKTEPETRWHQEWKGQVPTPFREVVVKKKGRIKRADIKAATDTVIELQHSPISASELDDREDFYGRNMFWIFDSDGRKRTISKPDSSLWARDVKWFGFRVFHIKCDDLIPGIGCASRPNLVDIGSEVCRVIPQSRNNGRSFIAAIQPGDRVRVAVKNTCREELPWVDGFLMDQATDWQSKKAAQKARRAGLVGTGNYMTEYCPRGYVGSNQAKWRPSPSDWAEIMRADTDNVTS